MIPVQDLFEVHLTVTDLDRAIEFYRDVLGFRLAHLVPARQAAFFWIGSAGNAMLGLWGTGSAPQRTTLNTALRPTIANFVAAPSALRSAGVTPLDFDGQPTEQRVVFAWMPAASVFFHDPDGHFLEDIAMLPAAPRPGEGIVRWRDWEFTHRAAAASEPSRCDDGNPR